MPPTAKIAHIFVLMLENRSFDHMLGLAAITGGDAETGASTPIDGLKGGEANVYNGRTYTVSPGAPNRMPTDPMHEFPDIVHQLCGPGAVYPSGGIYPPIDDSGFAASYAASGGQNPGDAMQCFDAAQLPVLNALAREFAVCDGWHASLPGPTWPNRMFAHAASSAGLDHSPSTAEIADWDMVDGFSFPNGSLYDRLAQKGVSRCLYGGDDFPMVAALKGIHVGDIRPFHQFAGDLAADSYPYSYVFIEPSYDVINKYRNGTSQHPLADVTQGEALIKTTYEAIRNSAIWPGSLLIVTWDEHGGFYDHAIPPAAPAPGDTAVGAKYNRYGFTFERYGPRVPAVVVSPLIARNRIDHRLYDHASIPATVEAVFGLAPMTERDRQARALDPLLTLTEARTDCPATLPDAAPSAAPAMQAAVAEGGESADQGNLPVILHAAMRQELELEPQRRQAIVDRVRSIRTRADARDYLAEVQAKVLARRSAAER